MKITVLGSGTSSGVPTIGCRCQTCTSTDPHDKRLRPSIWIQDRDRSIIIDTSTDFRQQCLLHQINTLDAVVYTHHHYDHIAGFDDLRAFNFTSQSSMPIYLMPDTEREMTRIFSYAFQRDSSNESSIPYVDVTQILNDPFTVAGIEFQPLELYHGSMRVNGYRIGSMAYCTDCNAIPEQTHNHLHGLDLLILDALRLTPHPTHFTIDQATEIAHRIGAKKTYFTHIAHDILHQTVDAQLPDNIHLAYDGLVIDL